MSTGGVLKCKKKKQPRPVQLEFQKLRVEFLWISQRAPFAKMGQPALTAAQLGDPTLFLMGGLEGLVSPYLAIRTRARRSSLFWSTRQFSLAKKAKFLALVDLRPSPPLLFSLQHFAQLTKCIFLLSVVVPQRKLRLRRSI
jgi:hypothetical protein